MDTEHSRIISSAEDRYLPIPLTDIEVDEYGRQLAAEVESLSQIDAEKKATAAEIKKRRDKQESVVLDITRKVNTKTDERLVTCDIIHDYYKKKVEVVRQDTGETVESRPMSRAEYERGMQMEL